jgi:uncharacterized repeat protein (TIGR03803 family)
VSAILAANAGAATLTPLYNFIGGADGAQPHAGLVEGIDSNFYGTTYAGGLSGSGTVFSINSLGTLTTLYAFKGGTDGGLPRGALIQGIDSNFYGTTSAGGLSAGAGTVFSINSPGTLTTLYRFSGGSDGSEPMGALVQGADGKFYGTTYAGGTGSGGTVFSMTSQGTLSTLHSFSGGADGANPMAGLVQSGISNFLGTTYSGGSGNFGTVFAITSAGTLNTLWQFGNGLDGANPAAPLIPGPNGRYYGTTYAGGVGTGAVFRITTTGALAPLYNFTGGNDGGFPMSGLIVGSDGFFYGATTSGGANGFGTVFKVSVNGALTVLHAFTGSDGASPVGELVQGNVSNFFGTTFSGGTDNTGTVFTLVQPCTYSLSPTHVTFPAIANTGTFNLTAGITNCPWTAASTVDWITITSTNSGLGNATISYAIAANTNGTSRVGTVTIAGKTFIVSQQSEVFGRFLLGTYSGLAIESGSPSNNSSGFLRLVLSKTGSFSAKLTMGGVKSSFKGVFDSSGNATNIVPRKNLASLQVILHLLDITNDTDEIVGTVSDGTFSSDLLADLALFSKVDPCPFAGRYAFEIAPVDATDTSVPQGYGYGALTVSTLGIGQMRAVLGDGTKISSTVPISVFGTWPLYVSLYKNQGSCLALVTVATNQTVSATANWFKAANLQNAFYPGGFATMPTLNGAMYVSPKDGGPLIAGSGTLTLGGGNLQSNLVKTVVIDAKGGVTVSPAGVDNLKLKISPTTGQFSGGFVNPVVGKTTKLAGSLVPGTNAAGYFPGTNETGFVIIQPAP